MEGIQLVDNNGTRKGPVSLPVNPVLSDAAKTYACAVKVLLQNWRQGTVKCKSRGEVAFSGKKPWRQKGTGRARAGMKSSPVWRKGGVSFGPQPRTRTLSLNKKQKSLVNDSLFNVFYNNGKIYCLDFALQGERPNTKKAFEVLKKSNLLNEKIILFLSSQDRLHEASFRNVASVKMLYFDQPNAYDLSHGTCWVFLNKDMNSFKKMVEQWNSVSTTL